MNRCKPENKEKQNQHINLILAMSIGLSKYAKGFSGESSFLKIVCIGFPKFCMEY